MCKNFMPLNLYHPKITPPPPSKNDYVRTTNLAPIKYPVNQPEKINQSDSFLPTKELACKTVVYLLNWLNK